MCGIAGIFSRGDSPIQVNRLLRMRDDQAHRGPDDQGLHTSPHIGLAFNRLAIIDLSPTANQPMGPEDGSARIVFNGEIYNYRELRSDLESQGRRFLTQSDTEVILQGYMHWGIDVVRRLNGMFAIALWDAPRQTLYLARDRVGKKPLFYRDGDGEVVFASEVRALVRGLKSIPPVDQAALNSYLGYLCVPGDMSIYAGVRKVPPGSVMTCTRTGARTDSYWKLSFREKIRCTQEEAVERLDELLENATRLRLIGDVPLGAFLSGGVDSSTVVAMMSRAGGAVRTFSVGFAEESHNELPHARAVAEALHTEHTEIRVEADAAAILPRLVWHYGEPFADSSAVPSYYVSEAARKHVKVALNGDGGDEPFAGYPWNRAIRTIEWCRRLAGRRLSRAALKSLGSALKRVPGAHGRLLTLVGLLPEWAERSAADLFWIWPGYKRLDLERLYLPSFRSQLTSLDPAEYCHEVYLGTDGADEVDRGLQVVIQTYLPDDLLVKMDIASMANSLETRSPLLDFRILEFAAALPSSMKFKWLQGKHLLKTLAARLVPPSVVYRPKQGFGIPLASWLRGPLRKPLEVLLTHPRFESRGYFHRSEVRSLIARHMAGEDQSSKLWALLWLELWFRMFMDGDLGRQDSLHDIK
ncbi:MAG TPA: asparagine synthase (glutamine-hydrolyzing) [Candidatus Polarisedimenticolia bacterium]|jgi:asparagine synthase (glutamine-hydrolysing)|nr:asparagine synthase (glutamine-hydrolyzing) [Candidatus Polarisedimenticolia bacterium]